MTYNLQLIHGFNALGVKKSNTFWVEFILKPLNMSG